MAIITLHKPHPSNIVRMYVIDDVMNILRFATSKGKRLNCRSKGHSMCELGQSCIGKPRFTRKRTG